MISHKNRATRGPAWASEPFTHITHEFWPNRSDLCKEALAIRDNDTNRFQLHVPSGKVDEPGITLDFQYANEQTSPMLLQYYNNFKEWFGEAGYTHCHYFYIDGNANYEWHRDNILKDISIDQEALLTAQGGGKQPTSTEGVSDFPVNCCINVVITEDGSECEFLNSGLYKYTAGILNTSHWHRVKPTSTRILARISFMDMIYEEVVHRIRKLERNKK
jgi:hypothetical protein